MRSLTRLAAPLIITLVAAGSASAQAAPNFAGTWEMNATKSNYGQFPVPARNVMVVEQTVTSIKVAQTVAGPNGDITLNQEFALDGTPTAGKGFGGATSSTTAKLDATGLSATTKVTMQQGEMTQTAKWTLSADGKTLTVDQGMSTQMGDLSFHVVFDKKP